MSDQELIVEIRDGLCLLTINRPDRRNSLSMSLNETMMRAVLEADTNPDVVMVAITGAGDKAFCAGVDLKEASEIDRTTGNYRGPLNQPERIIFEVLTNAKKPSMAIVNGPATGGGFELALACDLRVVSENAFFSVPEAKRGMGANFASVVLPQTVPPAIAMEWLFTGRNVGIDEADRWGLVNRRVPYDKLMDTALEFARDIIVNAPLSLQRLKQTFRKSTGVPLAAALRLDAGPDVYASEDRKEGAKAFLEKRPPKWQGR